MNLPLLRTILRSLLGVFFIVAGTNHFFNPAIYEGMIPPYLPFPQALNLISGAAELAGGVALFIPSLRRLAAWGLIALLVAVFPANIHLALEGWSAFDIPRWVLWARLPFQFVFIAWVYWTCLSRRG